MHFTRVKLCKVGSRKYQLSQTDREALRIRPIRKF